MEIKNTFGLFIAIVFTLMLAACGGNTKDEDSSSKTVENTAEQASNNGVTATGTGDEKAIDGGDLDEKANGFAGMTFAKAVDKGLLKSVVYFEFDQDTLSAEARDNLDDVAKFLKASKSSLTLNGHADERGTREYNLALSERRGKSVKNYLMVQGVKASKLEVVGYGEEKPASTTNDAANRRVELTK